MADNVETVDQVVTEQTQQDQQTQTEQPKETQQSPLSKEQIDEIQRKSYGYAFGQVDQKLAELGFVKPDGVKTTDYLVELLTKKSEPSGTNTPVEKVDDNELGAKVKALQNALREKETELESVRQSVSVQKRDFWIDSLVESTPIAPYDHLSEQEQARMISRTKGLIKQELLNNYDIKEVDGNFRFYTKDGSPVLDGTIDMNPISPRALIEQEFSEFLKKPTAPSTQQVKGTGTVQPDNNVTPTERVIPSNVKTANDFYNYLMMDKKLVVGSAEFKEMLSKAEKERPAMFKK